MASFVWDDLIHRARLYADDNHDETRSWIEPADWMTLFQVEYRFARRKWIRESLLSPIPTDTSFTGPTKLLNGVEAIVGVAQDLGNGSLRPLTPLQSPFGRNPFYNEVSRGPATGWTAYMANVDTGGASSVPGDLSDDVTVTVEPQGTTDKYVVRWVPAVPVVTNSALSVQLPYGGDERLVLGVLKRSGVKELTGGRIVQELINDAEAEMKFQAYSAFGPDGPRVRRVRPAVRHVLLPNPFPTEPSQWRYM